MTYTIIYEKITDGSLPDGYYYAHIPALDLTTHGIGVDGAKEEARDLITIWIDEKRFKRRRSQSRIRNLNLTN